MKPILFSTPMVEVILNAKPGVWPPEPVDPSRPFKWQTRRVIKPQPCHDKNGYVNIKGFWINPETDTDGVFAGIGPYRPGDILWVREKWRLVHIGRPGYGEYAIIEYAGGEERAFDITPQQVAQWDGRWSWRPSIFMPREAARLFLEVKGVRVERLQNITDEDAKAEGARQQGFNPYDLPYTYAKGFRRVWEGINAKSGYSWESNPYVWVVEFMRIKDPDAVLS